MLRALCAKQQIDPTTLPGFRVSPPHPHSHSPSIQSASSPGLGVSSLALSDTHSNPSTRSSAKSDKPGKSDVLYSCRSLICFSSADRSPHKWDKCWAQPSERPVRLLSYSIGKASFLFPLFKSCTNTSKPYLCD